jgi:anhydro-N-acetylmuramic acid kinase
MLYSVIGLMSGSSLDGLDIVFVQLSKGSGKWTYEIIHASCYPYAEVWVEKLKNSVHLPALDYQLLHTEYGHFLGKQVNRFITENDLQFKVQLIGSHGHTAFHVPEAKMTAQLGDGAAIAAATGINVISDLRSMDIAFGGQGAPIVPIGERMLFAEHRLFLNLGGIANISVHHPTIPEEKNDYREGSGDCIAFDICPAGRVLNLLANEAGEAFDRDGALAARGRINSELLQELNGQAYYLRPYPKSLANNFGTDILYPIIKASGCGVRDALRTYTEHICLQIRAAVDSILGQGFLRQEEDGSVESDPSMLVTGGGAFNLFLIKRLKELLGEIKIGIIVPDDQTIKFKEALIMALIGALRWREEINVLSSVTGAVRDSIGGAVWIGQQG